jgi:hypothetical protein
MLNENHKLFIQNQKVEYRKLGFAECPAFNNEKIYFNNYGFQHIIRKGKKLREISEQIKRFNILKYAPIIIKNSKEFETYT